MVVTMTAVALRMRTGASKIFLILAEVAEQYAWCQNLLENIFLEMSSILNENRQCGPLTDVGFCVIYDALVDGCLSDSLIKSQTAIRMVLLAAGPSPHIHQRIVSQLLSHTDPSDGNRGVEAIIRLISGVHSPKAVTGFGPTVRISLERLLMDEYKMAPDVVCRNANLLNNLLLLAR